MSCPFHFSRRAFLGGVAALAATPSASAAIAASAGDDPESSTEQASALPLEGEHQRGIVDPPQRYSVHCALDFLPEVSLAQYFRALTQRTRILVAGGPAAPDGIAFPATDSGELGLDIPTDNLTITVGVGAALFDDRFGLSKLKPAHLVQMEPFADDSLVDSSCHGDIILQICADEKDTALHALRDILRHTREFATTRWLQNGYQNEPRPTGTQRNHLGFKDGIVNPHQDDFDSLVWAGNDEPAWAAGGSYMAVRLIGMLTEFWDRISIAEQEQIFGRDRYTGGPLTGGDEWAAPDYTDDAVGDVIPTDAHIRLANPRTPDTADQLMLRRSYNYDNGLRRNGNFDAGLVFVAFQQDLERQFITVQKRLEGEPLADYLRPFGGGYFFMLPGLKDEDDYFGRLLLTQQ
ncbi:Dyp-type peroxidase [Corynebacterium flavescens]